MADKGKYRISKYDELFPISGRVQEYFENFKEPLDITIEVVGKKRSIPQNSYYHGVIVRGALEYYERSPIDLIKDVTKAMEVDLTSEFVHELFKLMFNKGKSTRKNDTEGMEEYNLKIREHFFHEYGKTIPLPDQVPIEQYNEGE